jgi:tRNA uridine 5-carbamoylmethylation protein Kti12
LANVPNKICFRREGIKRDENMENEILKYHLFKTSELEYTDRWANKDGI